MRLATVCCNLLSSTTSVLPLAVSTEPGSRVTEAAAGEQREPQPGAPAAGQHDWSTSALTIRPPGPDPASPFELYASVLRDALGDRRSLDPRAGLDELLLGGAVPGPVVPVVPGVGPVIRLAKAWQGWPAQGRPAFPGPAPVRSRTARPRYRRPPDLRRPPLSRRHHPNLHRHPTRAITSPMARVAPSSATISLKTPAVSDS